MSRVAQTEYESLEGMTQPCSEGLCNLLWALADTKLLLGYHYGEWTFGTPELEAAVANCSLSQTELGHVRLLHAVLKRHYEDDPEALVEARPAEAFANIAYLDRPLTEWTEFVAMNAVVDLATTRVLHTLRGSSFKPLRMSVDKMLDEERHHIHHGRGWFRTVAGQGDEGRGRLAATTRDALQAVAVWLGPADHPEDRALVEAGVKAESNPAIFAAVSEDIGALARAAGVALDRPRPPAFDDWDARTRRAHLAGPAEDIVFHLRGGANALFKLS
ncbi:MAG: phenylacetate-CoA oxygenase subunit PaaI [Gemmatimonadota bacterium]|nr:phenylacetate-CoA oxygenase subunit PaaI [Gemmatimonadota bacterium]